MRYWLIKTIKLGLIILLAVVIMCVFYMYRIGVIGYVISTPVDRYIEGIDNRDYFPIVRSRGCVSDEYVKRVRDKESSSCSDLYRRKVSLLAIPNRYVMQKPRPNKDGRIKGLLIPSIDVMLPDLEPSKEWRKRKGWQLKSIFHNELDTAKKEKIKRHKWTGKLKEADKVISNDYQYSSIRIKIGPAIDIYDVRFRWEGRPPEQVLIDLARQNKYRGKVLKDPQSDGLLKRSYTLRVGKYGEGLWPYKGKLARDIIKQEGNPDYELWEYGSFLDRKEAVRPGDFYYVPVVPEEPYQLYISCSWNGNLDYLYKDSCLAESVYDETLRCTFSFSRKRLNEYHEINQKVRALLKKFIISQGNLKEMLEVKKRINE